MAFRADPKLYVFGGTLCPEIGWYTYAEIDWYTFKEIVWYTLEEIRQLNVFHHAQSIPLKVKAD